MKRSVGLTLVGVVVIVLSALFLLLGGVGTLGMLIVPAKALPPSTMPGQPDPRIFAGIGLGFMLSMSAFGIVNGIGLIRRWTWCRYVTIVFGFMAAGISAMCAFLMAVVPMPPAPGASGELAPGARLGLSLFYLFWVALFAAIPCFLLRRKIAQEFRTTNLQLLPEAGAPEDSPDAKAEPRPILVWIVAGLQFLGVFALPMVFVVKVPTFFMGLTFTDLSQKVLVLLLSASSLAVGVALFRRIRSALWIALGLYSVYVINSAVMLLPGPSQRFTAVMTRYFPDPIFLSSLLRFSLLCGAISTAVPIFLLLIGRRRYFEWCERKSTLPLANA